jgi:hypothetical protein
VPSDAALAADSYFLSYSRSDEAFALRFARDLRSHGVVMWVDQLDIRPSEHWDRAIERAVRDCRGLLVILSPRSVASENVADEISFAINTGKPVLPVMIEKCALPLRITRMHLVDATAGYERALKQCVAELTRGDIPAEPPAAVCEIGPEAIATAKRQLTSIIGPVAGIVVDKAAARAASVKDLYRLLTLHIENEADRERFVALTCPEDAAEPRAPVSAAAGPVPAEDMEGIAEILTTYLGPIARVLAKRENRAAESLEDLQQRLAALIPTEGDRADFIRRLEARRPGNN